MVSLNSSACIIPIEGLAEKHDAQFDWYISISLILVICALAIRAYHQKQRLWVTAIFILAFGYLPIFLFYLELMGMVRLSNGICGNYGLVVVGKVTFFGSIIILLYETIKYIKVRRSL